MSLSSSGPLRFFLSKSSLIALFVLFSALPMFA